MKKKELKNKEKELEEMSILDEKYEDLKREVDFAKLVDKLANSD